MAMDTETCMVLNYNSILRKGLHYTIKMARDGVILDQDSRKDSKVKRLITVRKVCLTTFKLFTITTYFHLNKEHKMLILLFQRQLGYNINPLIRCFRHN